MQDRTVDANAQPAPAAAGTHGLKAKAIQEGRKFLFLFFYLWVLFGVFVLNQSIVLASRDLASRRRALRSSTLWCSPK